MKEEIFSAIFDWISKLQVKFGIVSVRLILPKVGITDLPGLRKSDAR